MKIDFYATKQEQAKDLADLVAGQLKQVIALNGEAHLALPGGTTPDLFMQDLSKHDVSWQNLCVTLTDERQVPYESDLSNTRLMNENFLASIEGARFIPLYDDEQPDTSVVDQGLKESILPLDVVVLGMGEDGHFASLFPNADHLKEGLDLNTPESVIAIHVPGAPVDRVSLTLAALLSAKHIHLLICGEVKKVRLEQATEQLSNNNWEAAVPIQSLIQHADAKLHIHYTD